MEKKRSHGVTILSILIILGSLMTILSNVPSTSLNMPISIYFYLMIAPLSILTAIFLFRLNNIARVAIILISILVAAETLITSQYVRKNMEQQLSARLAGDFGKSLEAQIKQQNPKLTDEQVAHVKEIAMNRTKPIMNMTLTLIMLASLGFNCCVIYFFTRPPVVMQFKRS